MSIQETIVEGIRRWRSDPVRFVRECLKAEPDDWQADVLRASVDHSRVVLKASKGPGKSTVLAWLAWWFLVTRPHPKVVATSISGDNLKDGLWSELSKWQKNSEFLKEAFQWSSERITLKSDPETWWASARQWSKGADATQQSNTLAGIHADHVLFLIDEAGGIPDAVVATAEAGLANAGLEGREGKLVLAGNPTHLEGPLYRACQTERDLWYIKEITSDPTDPKRTKRVSKEWAEDQIKKYGRDNPWVIVNVFGDFPPGQANKLISPEVVRRAMHRDIENKEFDYAPMILGVDVARFGDDRTVITLRQGRMMIRPHVMRNADNVQVARQVAAIIDNYEVDATFIDQTGVGGGVVDILRDLKYDVRGVDNSSRPSDPRFLNLRCDMWFKVSEWIATAVMPDMGELVAELTAPIYWFRSDGKMQLESKEDLKKKGLPSPDLADSLALTFAYPVFAPDRRVKTLMKNAHLNVMPKLRGEDDKQDYDPYKTFGEE